MATHTKRDRVGPDDLGIDPGTGKDADVFKWLVACKLFGRPIGQEIAADAFRELDKAGVLTARKLADADWQHLVDLLGAGGYRRYDESTAEELIQLGQDCLDRYDGKLSRLPRGAETKKEIRSRIQQFKGLGPTATDIFLREVGPAWNL